jgi:hypothetical protein
MCALQSNMSASVFSMWNLVYSTLEIFTFDFIFLLFLSYSTKIPFFIQNFITKREIIRFYTIAAQVPRKKA